MQSSVSSGISLVCIALPGAEDLREIDSYGIVYTLHTIARFAQLDWDQSTWERVRIRTHLTVIRFAECKT